MQIRVAEEKDAAALVEIYSYYVEKTAITFEYETPSTEEFAERIHNKKEKYPYIVAEDSPPTKESGKVGFFQRWFRSGKGKSE